MTRSATPIASLRPSVLPAASARGFGASARPATLTPRERETSSTIFSDHQLEHIGALLDRLDACIDGVCETVGCRHTSPPRLAAGGGSDAVSKAGSGCEAYLEAMTRTGNARSDLLPRASDPVTMMR